MAHNGGGAAMGASRIVMQRLALQAAAYVAALEQQCRIRA
jgi:hypothetical protein